jgi:hypothetical protein
MKVKPLSTPTAHSVVGARRRGSIRKLEVVFDERVVCCRVSYLDHL